MRRIAIALVVAAAVALSAAAPAVAAPSWTLDIHHNETHFPPGGRAQIWIDLANVGDQGSAGPATVTVQLPGGLTRSSVTTEWFDGVGVGWSCPGAAGASVIACTTTDSVPRHAIARNIVVTVDVHPAAAGDRIVSAAVSGGGAPDAVLASEPLRIDPEPAPFGIVAESFLADFLAADGLTPVRDASSHPDSLAVSFDFNSVANPVGGKPEQKAAAGSVRNVAIDLPRGFLGDPTAVGECTPAELSFAACPRSSQVGRADLALYPVAAEHVRYVSAPVFNMVHPRGSVADLAFQFTGIPVHIEASLDPANGYAVMSEVSDINESLPPFSSKVTIWGVPGDPGHDSERCGADEISTAEECPTDAPVRPFLTTPAQCGEEAEIRLHRYDSWQQPGLFGPDLVRRLPGLFERCDRPRFEPRLALEPTGDEAAAPTGLDVSVEVPQNESPVAPATPPLKRATVTLPAGMTVNPAFADGLAGCAQAEIALGSDEPVRCPDSSRIGAVELSTPLLPGRVEGSMYLAKQGDNPFGSLIAFYIALHDSEERGVSIKVPGRVSLDPATGQITTRFDDLPQLPFERMTLRFRSGERAPLVNPPTCGVHRIEATMASYAQPGNEVDLTSSYELDQGPGGAPCVDRLDARPFDPEFAGGTLNPIAGAASPLALRVTRDDADQELGVVHGGAPPGLTASLAGLARCSEAEIAAAVRRSAPGDGAAERADPSCPAASEVGRVVAGAGAGPAPIYVPGKVYLAGPYRGAPLSGVAVVPAVAGPIDLGTVVVRAAADVDPRTAQVSIRSDELPQVVNGVLIRVRDVRIHLDRPGFTINPTGCQEKSLVGTLFSSQGKAKALATRFQVGECAALGFRPRLGLRLKGGVRRGGHPALRATYAPRPGDANLRRLALVFPRSEFIENAHFRTICTRLQSARDACPPGSVYGRVRAWTPLLDTPLEGPVYLRSSDSLLPDAVLALDGEISAEVVVRIDSVGGRLRATVEGAPDVPVSRVVVRMRGGGKGLFVNSRHLCRGVNRARAGLSAHNGRRALLRPRLRPRGCRRR